MHAIGLLAGAHEGLGLVQAPLDGQGDEGRASGRVADGDGRSGARLRLVVGAGRHGAVEDAGHCGCHGVLLFSPPWGGSGWRRPTGWPT